MAKAILSGIFSSGFLKPHQVTAYDVNPETAAATEYEFNIRMAGDLTNLTLNTAKLLVSVKPKDVGAVTDSIKNVFAPGKNTIISIAAGVPAGFYEKKLNAKAPVIRVMPNTPVLVNKGIAVISKGKYADKEDLEFAVKVFAGLGEYVIVDEKLQNAATAISGSGPAYFFLIFKLLVEAACDLGIKIEDANKLVLDTMEGSAEMLKKFNSDAGHLIKMVASPGGTTEAALDIFMKKQLDKIIKAAVNGAFNRAEKIQDKILHGD